MVQSPWQAGGDSLCWGSLMSQEKLWAAIGATALVVLGVLLTYALQKSDESRNANLPLAPQGARVNPNMTKFDVKNPATQPRRIQAAWYRVKRRDPPGKTQYTCCAPIDMVEITFTTRDYFPKEQIYYKQLGDAQIRNRSRILKNWYCAVGGHGL